MRTLRTVVQASVVLAALVTGYRFAHGFSRISVETYCPFGGLESALSLFTSQRFTCAAGERNLALFIGLVVLTLVSRRAFCGWICPVGAVSEWIARLKAAVQGRRPTFLPPFSPGLDAGLRWLRLCVLILILWFTYRVGELVFRGFDPYYVLFSFHGHDVQPWSYAVIGGVIAATVAVPMLWCRYLCPLGAAILPASALGRLRIARRREACIDCGVCDRACPHALAVATVTEVRSAECTLCAECIGVCPTDALHLQGRGGVRMRLPVWVIPAFIALVTALSLLGARVLAIPSVTLEYQASSVSSLTVVGLLVDGVRCVDTAAQAGKALTDVEGVVRFEAYASRNRVEVMFDATKCSIQEIIRALEGPIFDEESGEYSFGVYRVAEIDGVPVDR
ncbi:4Fe-4S binding protein [Candidatus Fermentibacteria bacterium]|nr:4Fe-4S binding protein [Candidatus Fermentibacteria bacterium]